MIEIKDDVVRIGYEFDSDYNDDYEEYKGQKFFYEIGLQEAKETLAIKYLESTNNANCPLLPVVQVLDDLEGDGFFSWEKALLDLDNASKLKEAYEYEAMGWFIEKHYIMTEDDYESNYADMYNDEIKLRE